LTIELRARVDAESNTSTTALRVVGGDEKETGRLGVQLGHPVPGEGFKYRTWPSRFWGSFESETVKHGHEYRGTRTQQ
jgi:hypothetical protein